MTLQEQIEVYVEEQKNAWSPATTRSVRYTLLGVAAQLDGDPEKLWNYLLEKQAPYTRVTTWARVVKFWSWCLDEQGEKNGDGTQSNLYSKFRKRNARSFKHTYERKPSNLDFHEVKARVSAIKDPSVRKKALELLYTGMRYAESFTVRHGKIIGKGGKPRDLLNMPHVPGPEYTRSYQTFWRQLKQATGLTPHTLRKVMANHIAHEDDFNLFDLCEIFGWADPKTARSYVAPKRKNKLKEKLWRATNGADDSSSDDVFDSVSGSRQGAS